MAMQTCGRSAPTPSAPSALTERSKPGLGQGPGLGALRHGNAVYRYMQEQSPVTTQPMYIAWNGRQVRKYCLTRLNTTRVPTGLLEAIWLGQQEVFPYEVFYSCT